jgi:small subunit ribosomal protein S20
MPISRSSKKSLRKSITNRKANLSFKNKFKEMVKSFFSKPDKEAMELAQSAIDKAVKKGVIHKNKASRMKSQLSKKVGGEAVVAKKVKKVTKKVVKKLSKKTAKDKMSK